MLLVCKAVLTAVRGTSVSLTWTTQPCSYPHPYCGCCARGRALACGVVQKLSLEQKGDTHLSDLPYGSEFPTSALQQKEALALSGEAQEGL